MQYGNEDTYMVMITLDAIYYSNADTRCNMVLKILDAIWMESCLNLQEERKPDYSGDFRMVDCETAGTEEISFPRARLAAYERTVSGWRESVRSLCRKRGILYLPVESEMPFEDVILRTLRKTGVLK